MKRVLLRVSGLLFRFDLLYFPHHIIKFQVSTQGVRVCVCWGGVCVRVCVLGGGGGVRMCVCWGWVGGVVRVCVCVGGGGEGHQTK